MDPSPIVVTDVRRISVRRFKAGSMFKLVFVAIGAFWMPAIVLAGVMAFFGAETVTLSGRQVTGVAGLVTALILAPVFTFMVSLFAWVSGYFGIRLVGYFRPLTLEYVPAPEGANGPTEVK